MKESLKFLQKAAEIQTKKGNDYQNPNSRVRQAMYYPRGCATILDTMQAKILRMQSVLEAMESDPDYNPNFESDLQEHLFPKRVFHLPEDTKEAIL